MATADDYADWIVANQAKKGTPEFDTVAAAYQEAKLEEDADPVEDAVPAAPQRSAGDELLRQAGLTGRHTIEGLGDLADFLATPIREGMNALAPGRPFEAGAAKTAADMAGLPTPESGTERVVSDVVKTAAGSGGLIGAARTLAAKFPALAPKVMAFLESQPKTQLAASVGAGAAGGSAREGGAGPGGQLTAALAGGFAPAGLAAGGQAALRQGSDIGAALGASFGNQRGVQHVARDTVLQSIGATKDDAQRLALVSALRQGGTEYVPGAKPTVGQVLTEQQMAQGSPQQFGGLIRLEQDMVGAQHVPDELNSVYKQQEAALLDPLQNMAGGATREAQDAAQDAARATRQKGAGADYEAIAGTKVFLDNDLRTLLTSPAGKQAVKLAQQIAGNDAAARSAKGLPSIPFVITGNKGQVTGFSAQGLQYVKSALDSLSTDKTLQAQLGIAGTGKAKVGDIRQALIEHMNKNVPGWEAARLRYSAESAPINKLQVGQALTDKLQNEGGKITSSGFLNVLGRGEDALLKKSTGAPRNTDLQTVLGPDYKHVEGVGQHLARNEEMARIAARTKGVGTRDLAGKEIPRSPFRLSTPSVLFNKLAGLVSGGAEGPVSKELVRLLKENPNELARLLDQPIPQGMSMADVSKRAALAAALQQQGE